MGSRSWLLQVPAEDLLALRDLLVEVDRLKEYYGALSARLDAVHRSLYDLMQVVSDLRKGGQP